MPLGLPRPVRCWASRVILDPHRSMMGHTHHILPHMRYHNPTTQYVCPPTCGCHCKCGPSVMLMSLCAYREWSEPIVSSFAICWPLPAASSLVAILAHKYLHRHAVPLHTDARSCMMIRECRVHDDGAPSRHPQKHHILTHGPLPIYFHSSPSLTMAPTLTRHAT